MSKYRSSSYSPEQLNELATILERESPGLAVARENLKQQLLELMNAVGRADDGSDEAAWFREAGANEPWDAALAKHFRRIAAAEDPLDPELCSGIALTKLNAAARRRWASRRRQKPALCFHPLRNITSDPLSTDEIDEVREMADQLATYHRSLVRPGHPGDIDQDTLLEGIADIYIYFAKLDCHRYDLPHAPNSVFIRFAHLAMRPFFAQTEVSKNALSSRWKRLKNRHGRLPRPRHDDVSR